MSDDIFRIIAKEISTGTPDAGLWTRAFAECDGDADKTKALYIRLRHADFTAAQSPQTGLPPPTAPEPSDGLSVLRLRLKGKLSETGKHSFYNLLGIPPDVSDAVVAAAIARLNESAAAGETLSSEMRYAMDAMATPVKREQYDRRMFSFLNPAPIQEAEMRPVLASGSGDGMFDGWWRTRVGRLIFVGAGAAFVVWAVTFMSKGAKKAPNRAGPELSSSQVQNKQASSKPASRRMEPAEATRPAPHSGRQELAESALAGSGRAPAVDTSNAGWQDRVAALQKASDTANTNATEQSAKARTDGLSGGTAGMRDALITQMGARENLQNEARGTLQEQLANAKSIGEIGLIRAKMGLSSKGSRDDRGDTQVAIPIPSQTPTNMTSCDAGGCWDNVGNRYNGNANGTMFRTDGKICQNIGGMVQCN